MPNNDNVQRTDPSSNHVQGTAATDVVDVRVSEGYSGSTIFHALNLSDFTLRKVDQDTFIIDYSATHQGNQVRLDGYDGRVDKIRTVQGDFTLDEIQNYGNNAPFHKQARIDRGSNER